MPPTAPLPDEAPGALPLPPGHALERELASGPGVRVVLARGPAGPVVLRLARAGADGERGAELEVLGRLEHEGLARLVDFGSHDGGRVRSVARSWIEGQDLRAWAAGRAPREVAAAIAELCPALEHLHARGFVHGDLKPENVIVTPEGRPVLTDFGLARRAGAAREVAAGSLFTVAPEVLLGRPADARSDLFALGVMLHELIAGRRATAQEFYGLFPARPFFEALGAKVEELPAFARELVAALVARDPARRPASALEVARTLRARLGLPGADEGATSVRLRLPLLFAREELARALSAELEAGQAGALPELWSFPPGEDAAGFFAELRYWLALQGRDAHAPDLSRELEGRTSEGALDACARALVARAAGGLLLFGFDPDDLDADRCATFAARRFAQARRAGAVDAPLLLARPASASARSGDDVWRERAVPAIPEAALAEFLAGALEGDTAALAARLAAHAGGARARIEDALERCVAAGFIVPGAERPRLRELPPDEVLEGAGRRVAGWETLPEDARALALGLAVVEGQAALDELGALVELDGPRLAEALEALRASGALRLEQRGDGPRAIAAFDPAALVGGAPEAARALHARRAAALRAAGAPLEEVLPHELAAAPGEAAARAVAERARWLRERGQIAGALALARRACALEERRGAECPTAILGELGIGWAALGLPERAAEPLAELERRGTRAASALASEVQGWAALGRREVGLASEHFERALELSDGAAAPLWDRALALYQAARFEALDALFAEVDAGRYPALGERGRWNLGMIRELVRFRRGEVDAARGQLEARLAAAQAAGDDEREASVRLNLGTLERRAGRLEAAVEHFERAAALYDRTGFLPGLAQARAAAGGCRRERGELALAEPALASALAIRERLGDASGARAVRGMLGLLAADRGRLRSALDELGESAEVLAAAGRRADAIVLRARADELAARVGAPPAPPKRPATEVERALEADPRVLVSRARQAWLAGDRERAGEDAARALALAERLQLVALRDEARLLLHWLARLAGEHPPPFAATTAPVREDHALLEHLSAPPGAFDDAGALQLARALARRGREDRAARLAFGVAARAHDAGLAREAAALAREALAATTTGLSDEQAAHARRTLLGIPDPWPAELERTAPDDEDEVWEMTVLSLLEINHRLVSQEDQGALLGEIVESACQVAEAERGFLILEEDGELALDTARDSRRGDIAEPELEVSGTVIRRALEAGRPLLLSNALDDPLLGGAPSIEALELRSILCVPFTVEPRLRGVIYVDHRLREGAFGPRAERMLSLLADQAALAIRQVRRFEEIQRLNAELEERVVVREADLESARRALAEAGAVVPASGLVGSSPAMQRVHALIDRCAKTDLAVLVTGESGTGKELAARALHELSPRRRGAFVGENCAALPPTLIEAELFGTKKGAFTGAERDRPGMFERADGGTLFLDEIGELPLELQAKLLRVLETGEVRRLGDSAVRKIDFRLVAATNRELAREAEEGRFRADLMYRLDALRVELPSLARRLEDLPELVRHFLAREAARSGVQRDVSPAVLARLSRRAWPGNVRELSNEVARLCVLSEGDLTDPDLVREPELEARAGGEVPVLPLAELERRAILAALEECGGDKRAAAERLGISRAKIYQRLKEWRDGE